MKELVNNKGIPLLKISKTSKSLFTVKTQNVNKTSVNEGSTGNTFTYNDVEYYLWGDDNNLPDNMCSIIGKTGVLQTGLNYKSRCAYGQGILVEDATPELNAVLKNYNVRNFLTSSFRDVFNMGNSFPLLILSQDRSKILSVSSVNARHCRISVDKTKLLVFGDFANRAPASGEASVFEMLDEMNPFYDFDVRKSLGKLPDVIAFPRLKNSMSNNDYYAAPDWMAAYESGWVDIAHQVPIFLKKAFDNALNLMWHVQIPISFIDQRFPEKDYESPDARNKDINDFLDSIENNLSGDANAMKAILNMYNVNEFGKVEEKWIIERLDGEIKSAERLATSAAANSEVLFSLMVNPSVLGAGMPGGPYAGNAGSGSDIREGLLVSMILSHIEKQQVLDPIRLMLKHNGFGDVDIKYRDITLTTLDSGKSTEETVS